MNEIAVHAGYLLLGGLFVFAGIDHLGRFKAVKEMLVGRGWIYPGPLLVAASLFQVVAGLGLAIGLLRAPAALGLAVFTVAATLTLLDFWRFAGPQREGMRSGFLVNIGLLGGLVLAFGTSL
jgi:putative oxidoreductase